MQVGVGIDFDQLTNTVYWSDIRYSVSLNGSRSLIYLRAV